MTNLVTIGQTIAYTYGDISIFQDGGRRQLQDF